MRDRDVSAFVPEGADRSGFCVEVGPDYGVTDDESWQVVVWRNHSGSNAGPPIRSRGKALRVARFLYACLLPEHEAAEAARRVRNAKLSERLREEHEVRKQERAATLAALVARLDEGERVTLHECPSCGHRDDLEEFRVPTYECGSCGPAGQGEDARQCETCSKFTAKATDLSCPSCTEGLEEEPETVEGVLLDGTFLSDAEVADARAAA